MKKNMNCFLKSVLAGMAISVGGTVYTLNDNKPLGAVLFAVGLYIICAHGLNLFTGKIGYLPENGRKFLPQLGLIWLGNLTGCILSAEMLRLTRLTSLAEKASALCTARLAGGPLSLLLLGIFCGMLMFAAVDGYKRTQNPLILFFCVAAFILCGFEHCVADMFYLAMAGEYTWKALYCIIAVTAGNCIGGLLIPLVRKTEQQ